MVLFIESKQQDIVETEMQSLSLNKQKCLVNPAFMRVCGTFKSLLITN